MASEKKAGLRLRVTAAAESRARGGHPWIFGDSVREQNRPGEAGELAVVYDRQDRFLAVGLFDPDSPIRVRILHAGKPERIDAAWLRGRVAAALGRRETMFDSGTTGYRCVNGENDGLPGLVADGYGETLVLKFYTAAWLPRLGEVAEIFAGLAPRFSRVVLRLSRNMQRTADETFGVRDGQILRGPALDGPVIFLENGLRFESDPLQGQKTGFFLDQRENRLAVRRLAEGRSVLNVFSFSGGFSVAAAAGGAARAVSLDISEHALAAARRNFALNGDNAAVARCAHETIKADAFEWLRGTVEERFDVVVLDPPSLARRASEKGAALEAYGRLIAAGMERTRAGGMLVACSCSAHVGKEEFFAVARETGRKTGRAFAERETTGHAGDHPATFPEGEYLKAIYLTLRGSK